MLHISHVCILSTSIQVPPSVSWSFDELLPGPSDEPEIALPPPPSLQNLWDQENEYVLLCYSLDR